MSFQHIIAGKVKLNGLGGMCHHLLDRERVKTNPNIDLSRAYLNYCIEDLSPENLVRRVNDRIAQLHLKKRPRSDAVGLEDFVISASADFMLNLSHEQREQYFRDSLHFLQKRYGKENVMYCQCHLDEATPHIHVGVVPITSDGRLSAKSLFTPKTLERLQTDFHESVSKFYGLERGEHHSKKYLPLQQFKCRQAKLEAAQFTEDLHSAIISQQQLSQATESAHFASSGLFFSSEDTDTIQLPTEQFLYLKQVANEGTKALAAVRSLQADNQKLSHDLLLYKSDADEFFRKFHKLDEATKLYTSAPNAWREKIDTEVLKLQTAFTQYCHDVNRMTLKVFLASNGDFQKTIEIMVFYFTSIGINDIQVHIRNVLEAARRQFKHNLIPTVPSPSWKPPKPSQTDYTQISDSSSVEIHISLLQKFDWTTVNGNLLNKIDTHDINR